MSEDLVIEIVVASLICIPVAILVIGIILTYKDIKYPKVPKEFGFKIFDYILLYLITIIVGLGFLLEGIMTILWMFATLFNIDNIQKDFSISDIFLYILGIICLVFGIYIFKQTHNVLSCNCKSITINHDAKKIILKSKKSWFIELPFDAISKIDISSKWVVRGLYYKLIKIFAKTGEICMFLRCFRFTYTRWNRSFNT